MPRLYAALALVAAMIPALAAAAAPEPKKPIEMSRFMGRWYEILRTPNAAQHNCHAAHQTWAPAAPGRVSIAQVCHRDSPTGPEKTMMTPARVLDAGANTKFEASFFGGLIHKQYWVLDHADDYAWMIASTADGNYVAVLARTPDLSAGEISSLKSRITAMGLNTGRLVDVEASADSKGA